MPKLSQRSIDMPSSPIRKLAPYADRAKKNGTKVYHLNIGQPDIRTPKVALDVLKSFDHNVLEYGHSAGNETYRDALARYYQKRCVEVQRDDILVTTGGSEAILFAYLTCLNPGDEIIVPEPFYANYNAFAAQTDVVIKTIPSYIENDFALPSVEEFEKVLTPRTKAIMICNPNNPTGTLYTKEELMILRDIVKRDNLFLICDEVYKEFCYDGSEHFSVMQLEGVEENVVLIDSISKRYSMCGARVGALVTRNREVIEAALKYAQSRLCPPLIGQALAEAAVNTPDEYFNEVYQEYVERRNCLVGALNKIEGVYSPLPKGSFYTIVKLPIDDCDKFAQWLLEKFSYENQTVMVAPASGFYADPSLGKDQVRIAYVLKKEDLLSAAKCLEIALKQYAQEMM